MFSSFSNSASLSQSNKAVYIPPVMQGPFIGLQNGLLEAQTISVGNYINAPFNNWDVTGNLTTYIHIWNNETTTMSGGTTPLPSGHKYFLWTQLYNQANSWAKLTQNVYFPTGVYTITVYMCPRINACSSSLSAVISINGTNTFTPKTYSGNVGFTQVTGSYNCSVGGTYPVCLSFINTAANDSAIFMSNIVITKN